MIPYFLSGKYKSDINKYKNKQIAKAFCMLLADVKSGGSCAANTLTLKSAISRRSNTFSGYA